MKWKADMKIERDNGLWISRGTTRLRIHDEYTDVVELMDEGVTGDEELIRRVADKMKTNALIAGLTLAQFVEDYGAFLEDGIRDKVFI